MIVIEHIDATDRVRFMQRWMYRYWKQLSYPK